MNDEQQSASHTQYLHQQLDLNFALQAADIGIWEYDPASGVVRWDKRCQALFGIKQGNNMPYEVAISYIHPDDVARVDKAVLASFDSQSDGSYDQTYRTLGVDDGLLRWVRFQGRSYFTPTGELMRFGGIAQEVTQQVLAHQQTTSDADLFRSLANSISQLAWIADANGWIYWYNDRWYAYTGTNLEQMQGWGWRAVHQPDRVEEVTETVKRGWQTGEAFELTFPLRAKDGHYRQFLTRIRPVRDQAGQLTHWVGTNTDIDEQKRQEVELEKLVEQRTQELAASNEELLASNEEYAAINEELEEANQLLMRSNDNLQTFAYIASHDLQEPLRKIQQFSNLLQTRFTDSIDGEAINYLERIQGAANRMSLLMRDLLSFSRISTRRSSDERVNLNQVVSEVLEVMDLAISETDAHIQVDALPTVLGDGTQLGQLMQNLLSNALKFRRAGTSPVVKIGSHSIPLDKLPPSVKPTRRSSSYYCIEVSDNGIGFEEKYLNRIFGMFQRLHGRSQYAGTGVGLAICEKVAVNHGGGITARSQPNQGATFVIYLPAE